MCARPAARSGTACLFSATACGFPSARLSLTRQMRHNHQSHSAILKDLHQYLFGHEVQVIRLTPNLHGPISPNILHILWRFLPLHAFHQILCHLLSYNIVLAFKRTSCSKTRNNFRQASDHTCAHDLQTSCEYFLRRRMQLRSTRLLVQALPCAHRVVSCGCREFAI